MKMKRFLTVTFSVLLMATLSMSAFAESLVAYFPFDGDVKDASGNGNHGEIVGTLNYVEGKFGKAIELNNGVYVEMEASDSLHGDLFKAAPFTISAWIYPKTSTNYGHVWRSLPISAGHNTLFIIEDKGIISWRGFVDGQWSWGDLCETDPGLFEADTWVHVAVTNDGDKFRIHVNGEKAAETDFQETDGGNTTYLIGSRHIAGETFAGLIDDYAIFSRALNAVEINLIMNQGVKRLLQKASVPVANAPNRKVHVIWYRAANEDLRGPSFWDPDADYMTHLNVQDHLQDVADFFTSEVGATFEFKKFGGGIYADVRYMQSDNFFVNDKDKKNYNPTNQDHFLDTDPDFWDKAWIDIEPEWNRISLDTFDPSRNIYLVIVQSDHGKIGFNRRTARGLAERGYGRAMVTLGSFDERWNGETIKLIIAHELGHVFGLHHDFSKRVIMSYDDGFYNAQAQLAGEQFSQRSKNWLSVHRDFSNYQFGYISVDSPMEIKISKQPFGPNNSGVSPGDIIPFVSNTSTGTYEIYVQVSDPDGLHQVELIAPMLQANRHGPDYDPTGKNQHPTLAKYITANNADTSPNVAGYIDPSNLTAWTGMIDITEWVQQSDARGEQGFALEVSAIDSRGNILYYELFNNNTHYAITLNIFVDVNGDGEVTIKDLILVSNALGQTGANAADVNGDGEVTIEDLILVGAAFGRKVAAASAVVRQQGAAHLTPEDVQHWLTLAQQANLTDATSVRGIRFLEQLLAALIPKETALLPNYPNPFNPETWIPYQLAIPADVTLTIYDIQGRVVRTLDLGHQRAGIYQSKSRAAYWDGKNAQGESVASGVYFYTLTAGDFTATRKLLIRK